MLSFFFFNDPAPTEIYTLSLHDALPISGTRLDVHLASQVGRPYDAADVARDVRYLWNTGRFDDVRVEEIGRDTSELQSQSNLVCRLLLEKKKKKQRCLHPHK